MENICVYISPPTVLIVGESKVSGLLKGSLVIEFISPLTSCVPPSLIQITTSPCSITKSDGVKYIIPAFTK